MTIRIHQVKIAPKYFKAVVSGEKTAELRKNDRAYKVGDVLSLCEFKAYQLTGREWSAVITHILPVSDVVPGVDSRWVVLSIKPLDPLAALSYVLSGGAT